MNHYYDYELKASYTYDSEGLRTSKTVGGVTTKYYWDRGYTVNESDGTNFTAQNTIGPGGITARQVGIAEPMYLLKDIHGDTTAVLQNGAAVGTYDYDAFGKETSATGAADNPYRYCGEYTDSETGLIYLRNRYYSPQIGRFIGEDPYWNPANMIYGDNGTEGFPDFAAIMQSSNLYAYCGNNPLRYTDSTGLVAGEPFDTLEELAADWAWNYYGTIYYTKIEQVSAIYEIEESGRRYYVYTEAVVGGPHTVDPILAEMQVPSGATIHGVIHGHPMGEGLSTADMNYTKGKNNTKTIYAVYFQKSTGNTNVVRYKQNMSKPKDFVEDVPISEPSKERKEYLKNNEKLKTIWFKHATTKCSHGYNCKPDDWPRKW